jgi:hypothetical protein
MTQTDTEFYAKYNPEYNQVLLKELQAKEDTGSILPEDMCSFGGCMYETYGEEIAYVKAQPNKRIWTIVDTDGDDLLILAGYHFVNRLGYLITNEEWSDENEEYLID